MYSISIFSLRKKCTSNFDTRKLVLLPGLAPGSKSLLPYYSCHVAMMNMMILQTYKCNSLHCLDSNMYLTMYTM